MFLVVYAVGGDLAVVSVSVITKSGICMHPCIPCFRALTAPNAIYFMTYLPFCAHIKLCTMHLCAVLFDLLALDMDRAGESLLPRKLVEYPGNAQLALVKNKE